MNNKAIREILLVEDNLGDARLLREMVYEQGSHATEVTHVVSMSEAEKHLSQREVDIILLDLVLPDGHGLGALRRARVAAPRVPLVVLTGLDDEPLAKQALREGAQDYLIKGQIETQGLLRALRYAIERKLLEDSLFMEKERAEVTLSCIGDAVVSTDVAGNVTGFNLVADKMTGWTCQEAAGRPMSEVFRILDAASREALTNPIQMAASKNCTAHRAPRYILVRRDGVEMPIQESVAVIHDRDGHAIGAVFACRDLSATHAIALQMTHSAEHDLLTGLPNRRLLHDRVSQSIALARRDSKLIAVLFLDLDGFKHINDSLGHPVGDQLLQSISKRLVDCVRGTDTVSRQGGDEFIILLTDVQHPDDAAVMANRILQVVAKVHRLDQLDLHITTSIGVSIYPDDGQDAETLVKNADTAMYQAKENGRQNYQFFKPAMFARAVERQSIEESLRRALDRHEFALHYQPKINLLTGAITGAEALIRWEHPTRGPLLPAQFIPIAEDCGLILPIGNWVLRQACQQARAWADAGLPTATIAVNVSAMEFRDENFLQGLFTIFSDTGVNPRSLQLELTESVLMKRAEPAASVLNILREWGVHIAIDDFGTGYSSLSYLGKFAVDSLKIDQSFIRQISSGDHDAAIVTAVISMARSLKLLVVAEGVETQDELEFLQAHRCDEAQGYYFGRPLPHQQFAALLKTDLKGLVVRNFVSQPRARSRAKLIVSTDSSQKPSKNDFTASTQNGGTSSV